jgi:hypothetical protein
MRAPTEQPHGYGSSKAKSARCLHRPPGPRDCHEILLSTGDRVGRSGVISGGLLS